MLLPAHTPKPHSETATSWYLLGVALLVIALVPLAALKRLLHLGRR